MAHQLRTFQLVSLRYPGSYNAAAQCTGISFKCVLKFVDLRHILRQKCHHDVRQLRRQHHTPLNLHSYSRHHQPSKQWGVTTMEQQHATTTMHQRIRSAAITWNKHSRCLKIGKDLWSKQLDSIKIQSHIRTISLLGESSIIIIQYRYEM